MNVGAVAAPMTASKGERLPFGLMLRYGVGQMGAQIFRDTPAVLLPVFMITMLGVPPWMAGLAVLVPKLWVMLCDPLMGWLSDRWRLRIGRGPFLLAGAIISGLGFPALFFLSDYATPLMATVAIGTLLFLSVTGFSAFSVPYLAVAAELTEDPHERTKLLSFRIVFAAVGVILGVGFAQPAVKAMGGDAAAWRSMALIIGLICLASMAVTALGLRRVAGREDSAAGGALLSQFALAVRNRPFRALLATHFMQSLSQACSYTAMGLLFLYIVRDVGLLPAFTLSMCVTGLISQPLWIGMSKRLGKVQTFLIASLGFIAVTISWYWIGAFGDAQLALPLLGPVRMETVLLLLRAALCGILNQGFLLLITSLFTDTVEHGRKQDGVDYGGALSGIWSAVEKLAFACGPMIGGVILSMSGFVASKGVIAAQAPDALRGILILYSFVPAGLFLISLAPLALYRSSVR